MLNSAVTFRQRETRGIVRCASPGNRVSKMRQLLPLVGPFKFPPWNQRNGITAPPVIIANASAKKSVLISIFFEEVIPIFRQPLVLLLSRLPCTQTKEQGLGINFHL